jgi:hypothetical protein
LTTGGIISCIFYEQLEYFWEIIIQYLILSYPLPQLWKLYVVLIVIFCVTIHQLMKNKWYPYTNYDLSMWPWLGSRDLDYMHNT